MKKRLKRKILTQSTRRNLPKIRDFYRALASRRKFAAFKRQPKQKVLLSRTPISGVWMLPTTNADYKKQTLYRRQKFVGKYPKVVGKTITDGKMIIGKVVDQSPSVNRTFVDDKNCHRQKSILSMAFSFVDKTIHLSTTVLSLINDYLYRRQLLPSVNDLFSFCKGSVQNIKKIKMLIKFFLLDSVIYELGIIKHFDFITKNNYK